MEHTSTRFIYHDGLNHYDREEWKETTFFSGWAVVECNCKLETQENKVELVDIRTVTDVDGKPFEVADVIEDGAVLPHSIMLYELQGVNPSDLRDALQNGNEMIELDEQRNWLQTGEIPNILDRSEKMKVIVNPVLNCGVRYAHQTNEMTAEYNADYQERKDLYTMGNGG